jgi:hypothetical protein
MGFAFLLVGDDEDSTAIHVALQQVASLAKWKSIDFGLLFSKAQERHKALSSASSSSS